MNGDINEMHLVERKDWPRGTMPDGKLYSLECSRAMRALMADNDTSADRFEYDDEGLIQWVPVAGQDGEFGTRKPELTAVRGGYAYVGAIATRLNKTQTQGPEGKVTWLYAPVLVEPQAVA